MNVAFPELSLRTSLLPRIFDCTAYVHDTSPSLTKLDARALRSVFVGYSSLQKWYCCYHPSSRWFFISANVTFAEYEPFFGVPSPSSCLPLDEPSSASSPPHLEPFPFVEPPLKTLRHFSLISLDLTLCLILRRHPRCLRSSLSLPLIFFLPVSCPPPLPLSCLLLPRSFLLLPVSCPSLLPVSHPPHLSLPLILHPVIRPIRLPTMTTTTWDGPLPFGKGFVRAPAHPSILYLTIFPSTS